jgi:hypothetical protein
MIARLIVAALAMLLISAQVAAAQPAASPAPGSGILEGIVTPGPLAPLELGLFQTGDGPDPRDVVLVIERSTTFENVARKIL